MARKPTGNPTGRPEKEINWETFEGLCEVQCTQAEIASVLRVHPNTVSDRVKDYYGEDFSTIYKKFSDGGKMSLRRIQFKLAQTNTAMAIWLGKQWLGQRDTIVDNNVISEEAVRRFDSFMAQLGRLQDPAKDLKTNSTDNKS